MNTVNTYPPNYDLITSLLPIEPSRKPIFAYGDTIHNPFGREITQDLIIHEQVHQKQQGDNPNGWWEKYLSDKSFRLSQEIEAYGEQYKFTKEYIQDKKLLRWGLENMADALSGRQYGKLISHNEAISKIRNYEK